LDIWLTNDQFELIVELLDP